MEKDYSDLHHKTTFDFIDSEDDLKLSEELESILKDDTMEEFIDFCLRKLLQNAICLDALGYHKNDIKLRQEVELQFKKELTAHFNE